MHTRPAVRAAVLLLREKRGEPGDNDHDDLLACEMRIGVSEITATIRGCPPVRNEQGRE